MKSDIFFFHEFLFFFNEIFEVTTQTVKIAQGKEGLCTYFKNIFFC